MMDTMDVQETRVRQLLEGSKQYLVPLYQRPYAWEGKQRVRLWSDILALVEERAVDRDATHFMGSLVLSLGAVGPNGSEFLVVDGQQRLTTISILLCALRDYQRLDKPEDPMVADSIHEQFLADRYRRGDARLKVMPTQADRADFRAVVDGAAGADSTSNIGSAYSFFRQQLALANNPEDPYDIDRIQEAVLGGLVFVSITAAPNDNVYRIFESLNNTGLKLTQGDLVRNYLFMRLGADGEDIYETWWLPMQKRLSPSDLELLFWLDAVSQNPAVKQTEIYSYHQARLAKMADDEVRDEVLRLERLSRLLGVIRDPGTEPDAAIALRLRRLNDWGTTTVLPLVLQLLDRREQDTASAADVAAALHSVESFLVRRMLVGGPGAGVNKILLQAAVETKAHDDVASGLRAYLSAGRKYYANDDRVRAAVVREPFYLRGRANQQKLVLAWLEESLSAKERVDISLATIEHVLPQTLTPAWRGMLGADLQDEETVDTLHESLVHTLGNLTLTGYNSELSNNDYAFKRAAFAESNVGMNREIAAADRWGREEIKKRGTRLADQIIRLWLPPAETVKTVEAGIDWSLAHQAVVAIPAGRWSSYGDLAALVGTHPVPMGQHLATTILDGAHRVLQAAGTISPGFAWPDRADGRDPKALLAQEGVLFDSDGRASQGQRLRSTDLAELVGVGAAESALSGTTEQEDVFLSDVSTKQNAETTHGVLAIMRAWESFGGHLEWRTATETSCVLVTPAEPGQRDLWPMVLYPGGSVEVVFQHLARRPPFDVEAVRDELRERLNRVPGIDLPTDSLSRRPSFPLAVLAAQAAREVLIDALSWFYGKCLATSSLESIE
jgi:alkylated DNA nucleotide flippase Atl1